jgi:hypothetical protein
MTEVSTRPATVDDMAGVTRLRIAGWRAAYSHVMQQSFLDRMEALADREIASRRARFGEDGVLQWVGSQTGSIVPVHGCRDPWLRPRRRPAGRGYR